MLQRQRPHTFKQKEYDYLAKIVIIGNSAVGKTNLLLRFVQQTYKIIHTPTIGVDFRSKILTIPLANGKEKKKIKLQLWDTAGQQRFRTLTDTYFKGASGVIITYAINDRKSFEDVKNWISQLQQNGVDKIPKLIIGNKCDLQDERKVSCEEGRLIADQNNCPFMQVSAKQDINVSQMFNQLSTTIVGNLQTQLSIKTTSLPERKLSNILINQQPNSRKNCCSYM